MNGVCFDFDGLVETKKHHGVFLIEFFCCCCRVSTVWYVQYVLLINRYSTAVAGTAQSSRPTLY